MAVAVRQLMRAEHTEPCPDLAPGWPTRLAACESAAERIRVYAACTVPAILQTPAYAAAHQQTLPGHLTPTEQAAVASRGEGPHGDRGVRGVRVLLDEAVLDQLLQGDPVLNGEQVSHLQQAADQEGVSIQLVRTAVDIVPGGCLSDLVVHGQRLFVEEGVLGVRYASGSAEAQRLCRLLGTVFSAAETAERSLEMLSQARALLQHRERQVTDARLPR